MRDWEALVDRHLTGLALEPAERAEVIEELAAHLAETYEKLLRQGITEEEAERRTLSQVKDWQELSRLIQTARTKEDLMSNRVKQFWLPSLLTFVLSMGFLALIQIFGPKLWVIVWFGRSRWSFVAPSERVYIPWLLSLPLIGAAGAYLSNRAGGSKRALLYSIVFPVLPYLIFFLVGLPVIAILDDRVAQNFMFRTFLVGLFVWVLAPGAALLAGGLLTQFFLSRRSDSRRIAGN
jgi:hypothetical protein